MTLHLLTKDERRGVYVCRRCTGEWTSTMRAADTPCPGGHEQETTMDRAKQEAMDGSPARIERTLGDLLNTGKFADAEAVLDGAAHLDDVVIAVRFQCGPIQEVGVNGCAIEDVVDILIERLEGFQRGPFACRENAEALESLTWAKGLLLARTRKRQEQRVEGTNAPHVS